MMNMVVGLIFHSFGVFTDQINAVLEKNLGGIEVIRDYLKVVRSHALLSLNFLKSLRLIRGVNKYDLK
jgi:Receptor L domain